MKQINKTMKALILCFIMHSGYIATPKTEEVIRWITEGGSLEKTACKGDRDVVCAAVKHDGLQLKYASTELKADLEIVSTAVIENPYAFRFADTEQWRGKDYWKCIQANPKVFKYVVILLNIRSLSKEKNAQNKYDAFIKEFMSHKCPDYIPEIFKSCDKQFILQALKLTNAIDDILPYLCNRLYEDKQFIFEAVRINPRAASFASAALKDDKNFILDLIRLNGDVCTYIKDFLYLDQEIMIEAVKKNEHTFSAVPEAFYNDKQFVYSMIMARPNTLDSLLNQNNATAYQLCDERGWKNSIDATKEAVENNPFIIEYLSPQMFAVGVEVIVEKLGLDKPSVSYEQLKQPLYRDDFMELTYYLDPLHKSYFWKSQKNVKQWKRYTEFTLRIFSNFDAMMRLAVSYEETIFIYYIFIHYFSSQKDIIKLPNVNFDLLNKAEGEYYDHWSTAACYLSHETRIWYAIKTFPISEELIQAMKEYAYISTQSYYLPNEFDQILYPLGYIAKQSAEEFIAHASFKDMNAPELIKEMFMMSYAKRRTPTRVNTVDISNPTFQDNKDHVISAVSNDGMQLQYASTRLRKDKDVALEAIYQTCKALQFVDKELRDNEKFIISAIKKVPHKLEEFFTLISKELQENEQIAVQAVKRNGALLKMLNSTLQNTRQVVLAAVANKGFALQYASITMQGDLVVVQKALEQNEAAIQFVSKTALENREFANQMIQYSRHALKYLSNELKKDLQHKAIEYHKDALQYSNTLNADREFVMSLITKDENFHLLKFVDYSLRKNPEFQNFTAQIIARAGWTLAYASDDLKNNEEIVLAGIKQDPIALKFASERLHKKALFLLKAVQTNGMALQFVCYSLIKDTEYKDIALEAVKQNGEALQFANHMTSDATVVHAAVQQNGHALKWALNLEENTDIVRAAIETNTHAIKYASPNVRYNPDWICTVVKEHPAILMWLMRLYLAKAEDRRNAKLKKKCITLEKETEEGKMIIKAALEGNLFAFTYLEGWQRTYSCTLSTIHKSTLSDAELANILNVPIKDLMENLVDFWVNHKTNPTTWPLWAKVRMQLFCNLRKVFDYISNDIKQLCELSHCDVIDNGISDNCSYRKSASEIIWGLLKRFFNDTPEVMGMLKKVRWDLNKLQRNENSVFCQKPTADVESKAETYFTKTKEALDEKRAEEETVFVKPE